MSASAVVAKSFLLSARAAVGPAGLVEHDSGVGNRLRAVAGARGNRDATRRTAATN